MGLIQKICIHPYRWLHVKKEQTIQVKDQDFEHVTYHLYCTFCNKNLPMTHAKLIGGVDAFLSRKPSE